MVLLRLMAVSLVFFLPSKLVAQELATSDTMPKTLIEDNLDKKEEKTEIRRKQIIPEPEAPKSENPPKNKYADYPQELLDESEIVYKECLQDRFLNSHFDCKCRAVEYLDRAIYYTPGTSRSAILSQMDNKCADTTKLAGTAYSKCLSEGLISPRVKDPDLYCSCYGNLYSQIIANFKYSLDTKKITAARTKAMRECRRQQI